MMRKSFSMPLSLVVVPLLFVLGWAATAVVAQQTPSINLALARGAGGSYRLTVTPDPAVGPFVVRATVGRIGGDNTSTAVIGTSDGAPLTIEITEPIYSMSEVGCYSVSFEVGATGPNAPSTQTTGDWFATGCVDAAHQLSFPAFDGVPLSPPAPPSDVRIVRVPPSGSDPQTWRIEWRDNSSDEIAFQPGIVLLDRPWSEGGSQIGNVIVPQVPAGQTSLSQIGSLFVPADQTQQACGVALILVWAVGPDRASIWPGSTTLPACFHAGRIVFPDVALPDTGTGGVKASGRDGELEAALAVLALGVTIALSGAALRQRPPHIR